MSTLVSDLLIVTLADEVVDMISKLILKWVLMLVLVKTDSLATAPQQHFDDLPTDRNCLATFYWGPLCILQCLHFHPQEMYLQQCVLCLIKQFHHLPQ